MKKLPLITLIASGAAMIMGMHFLFFGTLATEYQNNRAAGCFVSLAGCLIALYIWLEERLAFPKKPVTPKKNYIVDENGFVYRKPIRKLRNGAKIAIIVILSIVIVYLYNFIYLYITK